MSKVLVIKRKAKGFGNTYTTEFEFENQDDLLLAKLVMERAKDVEVTIEIKR